MTNHAPTRARLMNPGRHRFLQYGGQLFTVLVLTLITTIVWFVDGEPAGFPWRTLAIVAVVCGPPLAFIGFKLAAPFIMCQCCRAIGYVDDIRRLRRCPMCRTETFYWLHWAARPAPWKLRAHRPAAEPGRVMTADQVIAKADRLDAVARSAVRMD